MSLFNQNRHHRCCFNPPTFHGIISLNILINCPQIGRATPLKEIKEKEKKNLTQASVNQPSRVYSRFARTIFSLLPSIPVHFRHGAALFPHPISQSTPAPHRSFICLIGTWVRFTITDGLSVHSVHCQEPFPVPYGVSTTLFFLSIPTHSPCPSNLRVAHKAFCLVDVNRTEDSY